MSADERHILVVAHTGRPETLDAAVQACRLLIDAGVTPVMPRDEYDDVVAHDPSIAPVTVLEEGEIDPQIELVIVVGGDGTILRAAETVRDSAVPLLGINLGHVGFLAESERWDLATTVRRAVARDYEVEDRMALAVAVKLHDEIIFRTWALNEAAIEKASRERMLEVVVEVDRRPLSSFGCDGIVISTPTGSTAYAYSGGGPIVWPRVEALLMVPLSAHALFSRPVVVGPESVIAVQILDRTSGTGVLWCDGRRDFDLPRGARVIVSRSPLPVRVARIDPGPFTDRLVTKFQLPVTGWRGPSDEVSAQ